MNFSNACCSEQPIRNITNADRLRMMTDEELAQFLPSKSMWNCPPDIKDRGGCPGECVPCWLDWLKQEAEEGTALIILE